IVGEVVYHTESFEPNIVRNSLISYLLFKRIRNDDYRVALCGEGADELFFGYADFEHSRESRQLMGDLLDDLHRTQLLRVDRTSMAFNLETRVPFLDRDVIDIACRIAPELKQTYIYGVWQGKAVLRQAFRDVLPWETITRTKATFSYGAGLGDVSMDSDNPLEQYAKTVLGQFEKTRLMKAHPQLDLSTFERALYLYYYEQFYQVPSDYVPPTVAKKEIRDKADGAATP
ncbi:MAG: asparagine synthase-related protein, partial [Candidatus Angelobacter sp.]